MTVIHKSKLQNKWSSQLQFDIKCSCKNHGTPSLWWPFLNQRQVFESLYTLLLQSVQCHVISQPELFCEWTEIFFVLLKLHTRLSWPSRFVNPTLLWFTPNMWVVSKLDNPDSWISSLILNRTSCQASSVWFVTPFPYYHLKVGHYCNWKNS